MPANIEHAGNLRRQQVLNWKQRLRALSSQPGNNVCSECPETDPTWASLLTAPMPVANGTKPINLLGVFCCFRCYSYHFQLGKDVCYVKSLKVAEEWSEEEVQAMELGGNQVMNSIYEATLDKSMEEYFDKHTHLEDEYEDAEARKAFVRDKYLHRKFFSEAVFHEQMQLKTKYANMGPKATALLQSFSSGPRPVPYTRCRSFENDHSMPCLRQRTRDNDFVPKPIRRQSRSFGSERDADNNSARSVRYGYGSTDDETTDDEQKVYYDLPGHLAGPGGRAAVRRSSMPLLGGGLGMQSPNQTVAQMAAKENRARRNSLRRAKKRASVNTIKAQEGTALSTSQEALGTTIWGEEEPVNGPAMVDLGYGNATDYLTDNQSAGSPSDDTALRRESVVASKRSSRRRRGSMPTLSSEAADTAVTGAPRKPQRVYSDDEDEGNNLDSVARSSCRSDGVCAYDYEMTAPSDIATRASRRMRRLSMPVSTIAQSAYDGMDGQSPSVACSSPTPDNTASRNLNNSTKRKIGNLGYKFNAFQDSDDDETVSLKPTRSMMRRCSTGGGYSYASAALKKQLPMGDNHCRGTSPSPEELGYGDPPIPTSDEGYSDDDDNDSVNPVQMLRRCSAGGCQDAVLQAPQAPVPFSEDLGYVGPSQSELGYDAPRTPPKKSKKSVASSRNKRFSRRLSRRCSTGVTVDTRHALSPCGPSIDELGYENEGPKARSPVQQPRKNRAMRRSSTGAPYEEKDDLPALTSRTNKSLEKRSEASFEKSLQTADNNADRPTRSRNPPTSPTDLAYSETKESNERQKACSPRKGLKSSQVTPRCHAKSRSPNRPRDGLKSGQTKKANDTQKVLLPKKGAKGDDITPSRPGNSTVLSAPRESKEKLSNFYDDLFNASLSGRSKTPQAQGGMGHGDSIAKQSKISRSAPSDVLGAAPTKEELGYDDNDHCGRLECGLLEECASNKANDTLWRGALGYGDGGESELSDHGTREPKMGFARRGSAGGHHESGLLQPPVSRRKGLSSSLHYESVRLGSRTTSGSRGRRRSSMGGAISSSMLQRADSNSSLCSQVSATTAILFSDAPNKEEELLLKTGGNSPLFVAAIAYEQDTSAPSIKDPTVDTSKELPKSQSKKEYWKARLAEKGGSMPEDISCKQQRRSRRGSLSTTGSKTSLVNASPCAG